MITVSLHGIRISSHHPPPPSPLKTIIAMAIKIYETCNFTSRERWNCKIFSLSEIFLQAAEDLKVPSYSVIKILSTSALSKNMENQDNSSIRKGKLLIFFPGLPWVILSGKASDFLRSHSGLRTEG